MDALAATCSDNFASHFYCGLCVFRLFIQSVGKCHNHTMRGVLRLVGSFRVKEVSQLYMHRGKVTYLLTEQRSRQKHISYGPFQLDTGEVGRSLKEANIRYESLLCTS